MLQNPTCLIPPTSITDRFSGFIDKDPVVYGRLPKSNEIIIFIVHLLYGKGMAVRVYADTPNRARFSKSSHQEYSYIAADFQM